MLDADLILSTWQRLPTLKQRRLALIDKWRWRAFLASLDIEAGKAPYGVKQ